MKDTLLKINLARPMDKRLNRETFEARQQIAQAVLLRKQIHREIAPALASIRAAQDLLDGVIGKPANSGFGYRSEPGAFDGYSHVYTMGRETESDLASENSPEFALLQRIEKLGTDAATERTERANAEL